MRAPVTRILVNFSPLKSGGGQNVALNFLIGLEELQLGDRSLFFLVAKGSKVHGFLADSSKYEYFVAPRNPLLRIVYERFCAARIIKRKEIDVVYTYFGFGFFGPGIAQVCGSADSNLYYPEVDFWSGHSMFTRARKWLIDKYRLYGVTASDGVVFENEAILSRARTVRGIRNGVVIKPSIASYEGHEPFELPKSVPLVAKKVLFLCGWHLNKNFMIIPRLAKEMMSDGLEWHFILTAPADESYWHTRFKSELRRFDVESQVSVTGPIDKRHLPSLYEQVDYVMLLSKLESFSNNIIEAWAFERPLIVANEEWALSACGDAARFVDRDNAAEIAVNLHDLASDQKLAASIVDKGTRQLGKHPLINERIRQELAYVEEVANTH